MNKNFQERLQSIDGSRMVPLVSRALGSGVSDISEMEFEPITGGFSGESGGGASFASDNPPMSSFQALLENQ